jgi:hypothetical protein
MKWCSRSGNGERQGESAIAPAEKPVGVAQGIAGEPFQRVDWRICSGVIHFSKVLIQGSFSAG